MRLASILPILNLKHKRERCTLNLNFCLTSAQYVMCAGESEFQAASEAAVNGFRVTETRVLLAQAK